MKKSVSKRIRVTRTGKVIRRKMAQDHFRAKKTGRQLLAKKRVMFLTGANKKAILSYLAR